MTTSAPSGLSTLFVPSGFSPDGRSRASTPAARAYAESQAAASASVAVPASGPTTIVTPRGSVRTRSFGLRLGPLDITYTSDQLLLEPDSAASASGAQTSIAVQPIAAAGTQSARAAQIIALAAQQASQQGNAEDFAAALDQAALTQQGSGQSASTQQTTPTTSSSAQNLAQRRAASAYQRCARMDDSVAPMIYCVA